jgi:predicted CopG family antitoxin
MCMHVYTYMATKTISITKKAYDRLKARKGPEESFSDVILRLTERRPLADYAGMLSRASVKAIRAGIEEARRERRKLDAHA